MHKSLVAHGFDAGALHGDMVQSARTETLGRFKANELRLMVCSDVAARGLDIKGLSHVFNFDVPTHAEDYVHRIGRTGRAGMSGRAFTLVTREDGKFLAAIEKLIGTAIPEVAIDGFAVDAIEAEGEAVRPSRGERSGRPPRDRDERRSGRGDRERTVAEPRARHEDERPEHRRPPAAPGRRRFRHDEDDDDSENVVGFGSHVPAFLQPAGRPRKA